MSKQKVLAILKKHCTVPNQSRTKFFIPDDKITQIANEITGLSKVLLIPPTLEEVKEYVKSKGYNEECAIKAYDYYTAMDWIDNNNKPVKNWKAKIIAVWFKPEYKIETPKTGGMVY
jgi:hypothetical protein